MESEGNKPYKYKYYGVENIILETDNKPDLKGDYITYKSHGLCNDCLPNQYMQVGLLFEYKNLFKNNKE